METVNKIVRNCAEALAGLEDGATVMVGGFGSAGLPSELLAALLRRGVRGLTVISNNAGYDGYGIAQLIAERRVRKLVCSYPLTAGATAFRDAYRRRDIELELVPQGTLVERIRCAGAGLGGFLCPITAGTELGAGKPVQTIAGVEYVLELPLRADFALIRAQHADRVGNLTYRLSARNFNPVMATAAGIVVVEADATVDAGVIAPEHVITPGIFIDRIVKRTGDVL